MGLGGLWQTQAGSRLPALLLPIILLPISLAWASGGIKAYDGQIFETESAYNYIQVVRQGACNYLLLNEGQAYHSYYCDEGAVPRVSVWSIMLAAPYFNAAPVEINRVAVIGHRACVRDHASRHRLFCPG